MKLSISAKQEDIRDGGSGSLDFIAGEGIFPVEIQFVSVSDTTNGAKKANFNILYNGKPQTIYGPTIVNRDGNMNQIGMSLINKLGVIAGLNDGDDLTIEEQIHAVGKDNKDTAFNVITDFSGMEVYLHIVREYTRYNGEVQQSLSIRNPFRAEDTASASEIQNGKDVGKQYEISLEKYCNPVYRDGVTAAEAEAFEEARRAARSGNKTAPAPTSGVVAKKQTAFGKRA